MLQAYVLDLKGKWEEHLPLVGIIAYQLALPSSLSSVHEIFHVSMLRKYTPNLTHVVDWGKLIVDTDRTFEEGPVRIMARCLSVKM